MKTKTCFLLLLLLTFTNNHGMNNNHPLQNEWINTTAIVDYIKKHPSLLFLVPICIISLGMLYKCPPKFFVPIIKSPQKNDKVVFIFSANTNTAITQEKKNKLTLILTALLGNEIGNKNCTLSATLPKDTCKKILLSYPDVNHKMVYQSTINAIKNSTLSSQPYTLPDINKKHRSYNDQYGIKFIQEQNKDTYYEIYKLFDNADNDPLVTTTQKILGENEQINQCTFFNTTNNILFIHHTQNTSNYNITVHNLDNNETQSVILPTSLDLSRKHCSIKIHPNDTHIFIPFTDSNTIEIFSFDNSSQDQPITLQNTNKSIDYNEQKYRNLIFDKTNNQIAIHNSEDIILYNFDPSNNAIQKLATSERINNNLSHVKFNSTGTHILGIPISGAAARISDSYNNYAYLGEIDRANQTIKNVIPQDESFYYIYDLKDENKCFLSYNSPGSIRLYNYSNRTIPRLNPALENESTKESLWSLTMSNDKKYCATFDYRNSSLLLINILKNKRKKKTIPYKFYQLFFHPHYPILAGVNDGDAALYDKKLNCIKIIPKKNNHFKWPYFSPSGESITLNNTSYQLYSKSQHKNNLLLEYSQRKEQSTHQ